MFTEDEAVLEFIGRQTQRIIEDPAAFHPVLWEFLGQTSAGS